MSGGSFRPETEAPRRTAVAPADPGSYSCAQPGRAMNDNRHYYARRAAEQRDLAERADDPDARRIHLELAELLAERAESR